MQMLNSGFVSDLNLHFQPTCIQTVLDMRTPPLTTHPETDWLKKISVPLSLYVFKGLSHPSNQHILLSLQTQYSLSIFPLLSLNPSLLTPTGKETDIRPPLTYKLHLKTTLLTHSTIQYRFFKMFNYIIEVESNEILGEFIALLQALYPTCVRSNAETSELYNQCDLN